MHPKAFLSKIKNVKRGVLTRSAILNTLEERRALSASEIATLTGFSYRRVLHHLQLLRSENIVERYGSTWRLTGVGQEALVKYI